MAMMKAKRHAPAHTVYKLCQRVLKNPIVAKSTYCLEITAKGELVGEGERNAEGKPEGRGTMVYASGNMYEGQWLAGRQAGEGRETRTRRAGAGRATTRAQLQRRAGGPAQAAIQTWWGLK